MALNKRQQKWILKNRKLGAEKISEEINVDKNDVEEFLEKNKVKPAPKYFYVVLIIIPLLFLVLLETGLRVFDYGDNYDVWIPVTKDKLGLNPEIGRKYFSKTNALPESIQDTFDQEKKENSFRVFVLGGSSAAGYPFMPLGSFSRYVSQRLRHVYPNRKIEVVNISLTAVNSYTIRDFVPKVLEQKPDLILIYAGHNEYYGALGIGSMESLGTSREMVNIVLYLDKYKTTQLVRNFMQWTIKIFSGGEKKTTGTLMSRMAEDQSIPLNSETYRAGLDQFEGNMRDVIKMIKEKNVNLIIGNLTSNIKDIVPFISRSMNNLPPADKIYEEGLTDYDNGNYTAADSLFRHAKDLDLLRFRAPEDMNAVIYKLQNEYHFKVVNIDSAFEANSLNGLIGNNLMTDHLHPTLRGYQLMGKVFYEGMEKNNFLPDSEPDISEMNKQDSITVTDFYYSELDSTIAAYKIKFLKNDWPFLKDRRYKKSSEELLAPKGKIDSLAYDVVVNDKSYFDVEQDAANYYLKQGMIEKYMNQMDVLIYQYPIIPEFYKKAANDLMTRNKYDDALKYLEEKYKKSPDAFSAKWLGIIKLSEGNNTNAINYLKESLSYNSTDEQVLYNLAGAYSREQNYEKALETINKAVTLNPGYAAAQNLKVQLEKVVKNN